MDSPFKPVPAHEEVSPAWRWLAQILLFGIAVFVALVLLGFVEVRPGKELLPSDDVEKKSSCVDCLKYFQPEKRATSKIL